MNLEEALVYLWQAYLDVYTGLPPTPKMWGYSPEQIVAWCEVDKREWQEAEERMAKVEAQFSEI